MSPERARLVVPPEAEMSAECRVGSYGCAWMIWARLPGYERPVMQFAAHDVFGAAHWLARYRALGSGCRP